jgi:uncharacterized protein YaaN involved in tellurite resistance
MKESEKMASDPAKVATATETPSLTGELLPEVTTGSTDLTVPEIGSQEIVSLNDQIGRAGKKISPERARELASKINLKDSQSIITFGVEAQKATTVVSEQMIQGVRTKDTGPVGEAMNSMVRDMKGLDFGELASAKKPGFLKKLLGGASVLQKFLDKYKTVESQIIATSNVLEGHRVQMLKDIVALDKLYDSTLNLLDSLDEQVGALDWLLEEINTKHIPEAQAKADATNDMADSQALRDMIETRDAIERKRMDLLLTRNVTIQALPSIRIVQANDKGLAEKVQSQLLNTIPLWKRTMAVSIAAWRSEETGKATKAATDFTNTLLVESANQLNTSNKIARTEIERGIFDVEKAVEANNKLIETINDSIDLAEQGKAKRAAAEQALIDAEQKLKESLAAAAQRQRQLNAR